MRQVYDDLDVQFCKEPKGCGYHYVVTNGIRPHTAFQTRNEMRRWMRLFNLRIGKRCWSRTRKLEGRYAVVSHTKNRDDVRAMFRGIQPVVWLSNGQLTEAWVSKEDDIITAHYVNPNYIRAIFKWEDCHGMQHLPT
jgi:hypothetical protein